ncbi:hypothetical protein F511_08304 [Dorcoceras hygrometricum]|uniref:Dystroglycan-like n=1 Tax=Dorcoceras hygrometricum TaxID=472368 RepID=A0A2Z7AS65_9LAMI|nr:hypothetical protein F511_08304 [Dorcoceras hygrometricum]
MASSLFTNTLHVCFDSVLAMDNPGMVSMFEALMASGLSGFLGCPAVLYEDALTEFFLNGSVRDGKVVSTIRGKQVEISEELFASTFEFPVDGLTDLFEIPKDIVFDSRSIFSFSGEQVSTSGKKREMKFEFRLLSDILAKKISLKDGSFDVVTQERFLMMAAITCGVAINWNRLLFNILKDMVTAGSRQAKGYAVQISILLENVPNLELGDFSEFPSSKILTKKTVHRYIAVNDKVGVEEVTDVPRVKKTPVKKAVSRKRPAAVDEPIVKKKRTPVGKAAAVATDSALEAVPVQVLHHFLLCPLLHQNVKLKRGREGWHLVPMMQLLEIQKLLLQRLLSSVAPFSTVPLLQPKRKIEKRKRRLALGSDDAIVGDPKIVAAEVAIENIVEEQRVEMPVDPVDQIIEQVIAETAQVETDVGRTNDSGPDVEDQGVKTADETELWFNLSYEEFATREANRPVETGSDTEEEFVPEKVTATDVGDRTATATPTADKNVSDDESMALEAILSTISDDLSLPSTFGEITPILFGKSISIPGVDEGDWYKASIPKINPVDKGKAPLRERDPVKGNPVKEQFLLMVADIELLVQLREQVIDEVDRFFNYFSLKNFSNLKIEDIYEKEGHVLSWEETDSTRIALQRKMYILTKYRDSPSKVLEIRLSNFVPGVATSAVDMKVLDMLSNLHLFVIDELKSLLPMYSQLLLQILLLSLPCISMQMTYLRKMTQLLTSLSCLPLPQISLLLLLLFGNLSPNLLLIKRGILGRRVMLIAEFCAKSIMLKESSLIVLLRKMKPSGVCSNIRQDAQNDNNALSLALKAVRAQNAILSMDLAATQKEVKDLKVALSKDFDDKLADIRNDLLEFRVETQEQLASLGAHLAELIAFITKGSDEKKGEGSSSRPQPPPDDQNRPSGGSGSRANDPSRSGGGTVSREGGNRGGDGRRRGDSSGSSKRRRSDSGGGSGGRINYGPYLPPKRDAEYWISGKRQF